MPEQEHSVAVFDPRAFYPVRSLVSGSLNNLDELPKIERFFRGVLLHDEMRMELEPWAAGQQVFDDDAKPRSRNVVVAVGPTLGGVRGAS